MTTVNASAVSNMSVVGTDLIESPGAGYDTVSRR
jgi:hypothetical protein